MSRQRGSSDRSAPIRTGARNVRTRTIMASACLTVLLAAPAAVMAFRQSPDEPSPASGTAQVVAQGVMPIDATDLVWQIVERTGPLPANAATLTSALGFLIVESGVLLVEDRTSGVQVRLPAGEAMVTDARDEQIRIGLGADAAIYRELTLVGAATASGAEDENLLFRSDPFTGPGARHDVDLVQDTLAAGTQMAIPAGALPTLVLVRTGAADIALESGDIISLGAGEAVSLPGSLQVTAAGEGAAVAVVLIGPIVPPLAQAVATPAAGRRISEAPNATPTAGAQPAQIATPAPATVDRDGDGTSQSTSGGAQETVSLSPGEQGSEPVIDAEAPVETAGPTDSDGDGLGDASESELGTDPLVWDTDGDGVSDGEEVTAGTDPLVAEEAAADGSSVDSDADRLADADEVAVGTDPTSPDSDGDGYYDGDEVTLGTDPLDPASFPAG